MEPDWRAAYADVIERLPSTAAGAAMTFCGNGSCIDARVSMHDLDPVVASKNPTASSFLSFLQERAARGHGGEVTLDWPSGPAWIAAHVPVAYTMGGTGPHAAWALSMVGAPVLLALEDRSELMLGVAPRDTWLAQEGGIVRAAEARPNGASRPPVFIFEFTAGQPVGSVIPSRSSRVIVKFGHFGLEHDDAYDRYTMAHARDAGAALVSGFTSLARDQIPAEVSAVAGRSRGWLENGLPIVHLELGGFDTVDMARTVLDGLRGAVTSVGMSLSELQALAGRPIDLAAQLEDMADALAVDRLCVHADDWAASVTLGDPLIESGALLTGCLMAASRAAAGMHVRPEALDADAVFAPLPFGALKAVGRRNFIACASPYLRSPKTTLGLGDTFTGGCLLALGSAAARKPAVV